MNVGDARKGSVWVDFEVRGKGGKGEAVHVEVCEVRRGNESKNLSME